MYKKRLSQSADRSKHQQSGYKQSDSKQILYIDQTQEMEYIDDILKLMARINRTQYSDAHQLKHILKTQNAVYINLLQFIINVIDPFIEIKGFSDEKFHTFLNRLGYPTKQISKTRFMNLGSAHTYLSSLHILSWLSKQADQILNINEILEAGQYQCMEIENQSQTCKLQSILSQYLAEAYTGNSNIDENTLEKKVREVKGNLMFEIDKLTKDINRLNSEVNTIKLQEPNIVEYQNQINQQQKNLNEINDEINQLNQNLDKLRQEMSQLMKQQLDLDKETSDMDKLIQKKRDIVEQQPVRLDKAKEILQKDHQLTLQCQQYLQDIQKIQQQIDKVRNQKTQLLTQLYQQVAYINQDKQRISKDFDIFENNIPLSAQLIESESGIEMFHQNDLLLDNQYMDIEFEQKIMNQNETIKRKSVAAYDLLLKRDQNKILLNLIPDKENIIKDVELNIDIKEKELTNIKQESQQLKLQEQQLNKQLEELECEKQMISQEISQLTDSTEELKIMRQIFQDHQQKQQQMLQEIKQKKQEIKVLNEKINLEQLDIQRIKLKVNDLVDHNSKLQLQGEQIEEQNQLRIKQYEQWIQDTLEQLLNRINYQSQSQQL